MLHADEPTARAIADKIAAVIPKETVKERHVRPHAEFYHAISVHLLRPQMARLDCHCSATRIWLNHGVNDAVQPARLTVFISYSVHDSAVVDTISGHLQPHARTLFWSQDKVPGRDAWGTIYSWIDSADLVVVVLTGKALSRALSVGNEVGYARKAGKRIIPLVGPEVPKGELGCLEGITYIRLDNDDPQRTITQLRDALEKFAKEQETGRALALLGLVALGVIALSK